MFAIPADSHYPSSRKEVFRSFSSALFLRALLSFEGLLFVLALPRSSFLSIIRLQFSCF